MVKMIDINKEILVAIEVSPIPLLLLLRPIKLNMVIKSAPKIIL